MDRQGTIDQGLALNNLLFDAGEVFPSEQDDLVITSADAKKAWQEIKHTYSIFYSYRNPQVRKLTGESVHSNKFGRSKNTMSPSPTRKGGRNNIVDRFGPKKIDRSKNQ